MSFAATQLIGFGSGSGYVADAVTFDGSNDYALRGGGLTGIANSTQGLISFWFHLNGGDSTQQFLFRNNTGFFNIQRTSANKWLIIGNDGSTERLQVSTVATYSTASNAGWHHLLASWNLATAKVQLYVDDVSDASVVTNSNAAIDLTDTEWVIGANTNGATKFNGDLFDFLFHPNFLDLSNVDNRRKFIDASKKPVYLGASGELPFSGSPIVFFHLDKGETANNFVVNAGSGGNFTVTGALTTAATNPTE